MILFGVNFNAYYLILFRKFKKALQMEEVRAYFAIIFVATAIITGSLVGGNMQFLMHFVMPHSKWVLSLQQQDMQPSILMLGRRLAGQFLSF